MWPFRRRTDDDFRREIEAHLAIETDRLIAEGLSPDQARQGAARKFGSVTTAQERFYESGRILWLDQLRQDVRYALRTFRRSPVFAAAAILTLGLGIGANTALFTVTRGVLTKTLPVERPDQLVEIGCINPRNPEDACRTHYPGFLMFRDSAEVLSGVFAFAPIGELAANIDGRAEIVTGLMLSGSAYSVLGMPPYAGRLLTPADDEPGASLVAVLSHQFWQRRFGGDPAVIGRTLRLSNQAVTIVGITPPAFRGLTVGVSPDVMLPIGAANIFRRPGSLQARAAWWVYILGRLKPGVSVEQAQTALDPTFRSTLRMTKEALPPEALASGFKEFIEGFRFRISPAATGSISDFRHRFEQPLRILWGVVAVVLLITCANLAGLLLSRAVDRRREFGVRLALGAGRARLARQVLTEALVLAFCGGALALGIGGWTASAALALGAGEAGVRAVDTGPDALALAFTALVSTATGLAIGMASVWRAAGADPAEAWRASLSHRASAPLARTVIAAQVALATVLLITAVSFVRSLANARGVDPGFDSEHLVTVTVAPGMAGYAPDAAWAYLRRVVAATEALPGVRAATYHAVPIATGLISQTSVSVPGLQAPSDQMVGQNRVGPRFAEALGLRLITGRDLRNGDERSSPRAAMVNERFARQFFQTINVVGRTFLVSRQEYSIVGVVGDAHDRSVVQSPENWIYIPSTDPEPRMRLTVRTSGDVLSVAAGLEKVLQEIDSAVPVLGVRAVSAQIEETLRRERLLATLGTAFGALALALVAIGVYAMFSGMISRRTREIGIRMAIGANSSRIARLLARDAGVVALSGIAAGTVGAIAGAGAIRSQLFNVEPTDAGSLTTAAIILVAATVVAVWIPAWRAIRIRPAAALRVE